MGRAPDYASFTLALDRAPHGVGGTQDASRSDGTVMDIVAWWAMHALCRAITAPYLGLRVQGLYHLPALVRSSALRPITERWLSLTLKLRTQHGVHRHVFERLAPADVAPQQAFVS
jgi:hypothetical protein